VPPITLSGLALTTYILLLLTVVSLWIRAVPMLWAGLLSAAVLFGYLSGILAVVAIVPIALMAGTCWYYGKLTANDSQRPTLKIVAAIMILVIASLLALHLLPGFNNQSLIRNVVLSPLSVPYSQWLNFDKTIAGVLILGLCYRGLITTRQEWFEALLRGVPFILINIVIVVVAAFVLGFVRFDPKWTTFFFPWAAINLFFTCMSEEVLFRGFIQRELQTRLKKFRFGQMAALVVSAILFGSLHFSGGITYVLLSTIAGAGYAFIFQRTGRIEMSMLAHFSLNATHFLLLTYPRAI